LLLIELRRNAGLSSAGRPQGVLLVERVDFGDELARLDVLAECDMQLLDAAGYARAHADELARFQDARRKHRIGDVAAHDDRSGRRWRRSGAQEEIPCCAARNRECGERHEPPDPSGLHINTSSSSLRLYQGELPARMTRIKPL